MIHGFTSGSYSNKLYVYNPINNIAKVTSVNVGTTDTISAISMINAPEPGAWIGLGVAVLYFIGVWLYNRWQDRKPPPTDP